MTQRTWTWTWNKREVHSPLGKFGVFLFLLIAVPIFIALIILLLPLIIVYHIVCRLFGRRGVFFVDYEVVTSQSWYGPRQSTKKVGRMDVDLDAWRVRR